MTTVAQARKNAIAREERDIRQLKRRLAEKTSEIAKIESELALIEGRVASLRGERGGGYSTHVFYSELKAHGCIACSSILSGTTNMHTHNGLGPECPTNRY